MKKMIAFLLAALLTGCAQKMFVHETKNSQDFQRDLYDCQQIAAQYTANLGYHGNPFIIRDETQKCLENKYGWQEQRK